MGDILNIAAVHNAGDPELNVGIRGNRFVLRKNGNVVYLEKSNGDRMDLNAEFLLSDGSSVETRILAAEELLEEMDDILDHLYEMYSSDEYWAAIEVADGVVLVDDSSGYPIIDNWSIRSAIDDLQARVTTLEGSLREIGSTVADVLYTLQLYDTRLGKVESRQKAQQSMLLGLVGEIIALRNATNAALNHRFLVDDS